MQISENVWEKRNWSKTFNVAKIDLLISFNIGVFKSRILAQFTSNVEEPTIKIFSI